MYLLDTDTVTWFHTGHPRVVERVRQVGEEAVATTVIGEIETLRGRHAFLLKASDREQLLRAQELLQRSKELLDHITVVPVDDAAASVFEKLLQSKKLKKIGRADLLIASIALARRDILVTRNLRHFQQVPGLHVENWVD
jgi:tRNA(fMet)-specific endonuclease VapC